VIADWSKSNEIQRFSAKKRRRRDLYNGENYEETTNVAGRIRSGELSIERLDNAGEQGRIRGGQRNVEASLILGADEASNQGTSPNSESGMGSLPDTVRRHERLLAAKPYKSYT
jgi:hypothetical protein